MKHYAFCLLTLAGALSAGCQFGNQSTGPLADELTDVAVTGNLSVEMQVDKKYYQPGQNVQVTITARNIGQESIEIQAPSGAATYVQVERFIRAHWARVRRYPEAATMAVNTWTLPAGVSRQWTMQLPVEPDWPQAEKIRLKGWINGRPNTFASIIVQVFPSAE